MRLRVSVGDECWHGVCDRVGTRAAARSSRGARFRAASSDPPARRSREATADDEQSRSTYLLNAAPHVLIVSIMIMIIIWSAEHVCVGAIFDSVALIGAIA
jgi:hypothetical protein